MVKERFNEASENRVTKVKTGLYKFMCLYTVYRHVSYLYSSALKTGMDQHFDMLNLCQYLLMVTLKFYTEAKEHPYPCHRDKIRKATVVKKHSILTNFLDSFQV